MKPGDNSFLPVKSGHRHPEELLTLKSDDLQGRYELYNQLCRGVGDGREKYGDEYPLVN
jgi:hypothetical protein